MTWLLKINSQKQLKMSVNQWQKGINWHIQYNFILSFRFAVPNLIQDSSIWCIVYGISFRWKVVIFVEELKCTYMYITHLQFLIKNISIWYIDVQYLIQFCSICFIILVNDTELQCLVQICCIFYRIAVYDTELQ